MKNITITLNPETARRARVRAAERNMSVSRYVGDLLEKDIRETSEYEEAMKSYFSSKLVLEFKPGERLPTREELHDRAALRAASDEVKKETP
jgi:hypothetical protein